MALCKNCGQELDENAKVCANCGTAVEAETPKAEPVDYTAQTEQPVEQVTPVDYTVETPSDDDMQGNKGISILSYFGILLLIPLFVRKTSEYCKFHVKQGANLFVTSLAYTIVTQILLAIIGLIFRPTIHTLYFYTYTTPHPVHTLFNVIFSLGSIFFLVIAILGMVNAGTGKKKDVPILGAIKVMDPVMDKIYDSLNK